METNAQFSQPWTPFGNRRASLTSSTIPHVQSAVQEGLSAVFMRDMGYLVDFKAHSAMCLEGFKGGLLAAADLAPLTHSTNGYGLHLVTSRLVRSIEQRVRFSPAEAVVSGASIVKKLSRPFTEIGYASGVALALAEAGLLDTGSLAALVAEGEDCGHELITAATQALDGLLPLQQRQERNYFDGELCVDTAIGTYLSGTTFTLSAGERTRFHLPWPEVTNDFLEVHILLCKTLDAMQRYLIPFQTPASAYGHWAQYSHYTSELYDDYQNKIHDLSRDQIAELLLDDDDVSEYGVVGMDLAESGEDEGELADRIAGMLFEMRSVEKQFSYRLTYGDGTTEQDRKAELCELAAQANEVTNSRQNYSNLCDVISDALEACIEQSELYAPISNLVPKNSYFEEDSEDEFNSSPDRFYDTIWVIANNHHEGLLLDALDAFNSDMQEVIEPCVRLPLETSHLVETVTIPVMKRTNDCLKLLRRFQVSLENLAHA